MFWGLFLVIFGGLLLLDRWDVFYGGFLSKLIIAWLIAWGGSILLNRGHRDSKRCDGAVGKGNIESTST